MNPLSREGRRALAFVLVVFAFAAACFFGYQEIRKVEDQGNELAVLTKETRALAKKTRVQAKSIQASLVESCQRNGNSQRKALRQQLHEEITEAENTPPDVLKAFNLSPQRIEELVAESAEKKKARLKRFAAVNCRDQFAR